MEEIDLREYIQIAAYRWRTIVAVALGLSLVTGAALKLGPRTYEGTSLLIFPKANQSGAGILTQLGALQGITDAGGSSFGTPGMYSDILTSRTLSEEVIKELQLSAVEVKPDDLQSEIKLENTKSGGLMVSCYATTKWVKSGKLKWLNSVPELQNTNVDEKTAYLAARMTNTYIDYLQRYEESHSISTGRRHRIFLEGEVGKTRKQLGIAEDRLRRFKEAHPVVPPPEASAQQMMQIIELRKMQIEAASELSEAAKGAEEAQSIAANQSEVIDAAKVIQENPVVSELKADLADAEVRRARLLENMTEKHPDVVAVTEEIGKIREKIGKEVTKVIQSETLAANPVRQALIQNMATLDVKRSGVKARVDTLNESMTNIERDLSAGAKDQLQYVRLFREVKAMGSVYESLLAEYSKAKVEEAREPEGFTVLDSAGPQRFAAKPRLKLTMAAVFLLGAFISTFMVIVKETNRMALKGKKGESKRSLTSMRD